ncbi:MAG: 4Fe-4S binding protein [Elusimicrobiota bacterium]
MRYLSNVTTLEYDTSKCSGCGRCAEVCPHRIFQVEPRMKSDENISVHGKSGRNPPQSDDNDFSSQTWREEKKAVMTDKDLCMECGACKRNCPSGAIKVQAGVGCAAAVINAYTSKKGKGSAAPCCG